MGSLPSVRGSNVLHVSPMTTPVHSPAATSTYLRSVCTGQCHSVSFSGIHHPINAPSHALSTVTIPYKQDVLREDNFTHFSLSSCQIAQRHRR